MSTTAPTKLMTAADLLAMGPDFHGELVRGRLIEMAPASWGHGDIALTVGAILHEFVREQKLGRTYAAETGFMLSDDPDTVRAPDAAFVAKARIPQTDDRSGFFKGPPDLAVEILSPSNTASEMLEKIDDYLTAGCRLVWVIDPERRTITVYDPSTRPIVLRETETLAGGDVLPGFAVQVQRFFE